jgi:hypothetical protein
MPWVCVGVSVWVCLLSRKIFAASNMAWQVLEAKLRPVVARWRKQQVHETWSAWADYVVMPLRSAREFAEDLTRAHLHEALLTWRRNVGTAQALRSTVLRIMMSSTRACMHMWHTHVVAVKRSRRNDVFTALSMLGAWKGAVCTRREARVLRFRVNKSLVRDVVCEWFHVVQQARHRLVHACILGDRGSCAVVMQAWRRVCVWMGVISGKTSARSACTVAAVFRNWRAAIRIQASQVTCLLKFIAGELPPPLLGQHPRNSWSLATSS